MFVCVSAHVRIEPPLQHSHVVMPLLVLELEVGQQREGLIERRSVAHSLKGHGHGASRRRRQAPSG